MLSNENRRKIQDITSGAFIEGAEDHCTKIRNLLCRSFPTSTDVKKNFESKSILKEKQVELIISYCNQHNLWVDLPPTYLTRGGEARIYLSGNGKDVIKANDGIYYATWLEFFNSILIHNIFFENTSYELIGFNINESVIFAILRQAFIKADRTV